MTKCKLALLSFLVILFISNFVLATSPLPALDCNLSGEIKDFKFRNAGSSWPEGLKIYWEDEYLLKVKVQIEQISTLSDYSGKETCEEAYPLNSIQTISIAKENVKAGDVFQQNSKISGVTIRRGFGTEFTSYMLDVPKLFPQKYDQQQNIIITWMLAIGGLLLLIIIIGFISLIRKKKK